MMGALVSLEALRYLTRFAEPVSAGTVWLADFASGETAGAWSWERHADCSVCGDLARAPKPLAEAAV